MKNTRNYVASSSAELYRRPSTNQPAPIWTSSSSSLQSSTFDHLSVPVASSSSSSGTSWNLHEDNYAPIATKSLPFQYCPPQYLRSREHHPADATGSPHYSPSEPQYHPYWNANSSGGAPQPGDSQEQLVTNNLPMFSPHGFNVSSDQYLMGNSNWSGGAPGAGWGGSMA
jgi:hypothetical protein